MCRSAGWYGKSKISVTSGYPPGSSLSRPPAFDKTVYITANERGEKMIECCLNSLVEFVSRLHITDGNKYVLTFEEETDHRRLKDAFAAKSEVKAETSLPGRSWVE